MKIRIPLPDNCKFNLALADLFVDEVLFWGMETGIDVSFYTFTNSASENSRIVGLLRRSAVFSIEEKYSFMFMLKWGAVMHKSKKHAVTC